MRKNTFMFSVLLLFILSCKNKTDIEVLNGKGELVKIKHNKIKDLSFDEYQEIASSSANFLIKIHENTKSFKPKSISITKWGIKEISEYDYIPERSIFMVTLEYEVSHEPGLYSKEVFHGYYEIDNGTIKDVTEKIRLKIEEVEADIDFE